MNGRFFFGAMVAVAAAIALGLIFTAAPASAADVLHLSTGALEFGRLSAGDLAGMIVGIGLHTRLKDLRDKRGKIVSEMDEIVAAAEKEKRELSKEEAERHGKLFDQQAQLGSTIQAEERQQELRREQEETRARETDDEAREERDGGKKDPNAADRTGFPVASEFRTGRLPAYIEALQERNSKLSSRNYRNAYRSFLRGGMAACSPDEQRALSDGVGTEGGFLRAPPQFVAMLIKALDDDLWIRQFATQVPVGAGGEIGAPSLDADPDDGDWTTELGTGSEDSTMKFGKREMAAHPLAKRIKVSRKLLRTSALPVEQIVINRLRYKFGVTLEKNYLTGNGVDKPLGVFTASADGVTTARDVSEGNSTTAVSFDGIISTKYSLKGGYWRNGRWLFHRSVLKTVSKLKDSDGQYLWRPSVRDGEPDSILGHPVMMSEFAPSTMTTGQYVGMFADFSFYWYLDALDMEIQRLNELYAETNQVGFIARYEGDGAPVLAEAFARMKLA